VLINLKISIFVGLAVHSIFLSESEFSAILEFSELILNDVGRKNLQSLASMKNLGGFGNLRGLAL